MIFNIALIGREIRMRSAFKYGEYAFRHIALFGVADDVGENIEAAAMGHSHIYLVDAASRRTLDQLVEHRDDGFAAFE